MRGCSEPVQRCSGSISDPQSSRLSEWQTFENQVGAKQRKRRAGGDPGATSDRSASKACLGTTFRFTTVQTGSQKSHQAIHS
jgi:hypothetical protein